MEISQVLKIANLSARASNGEVKSYIELCNIFIRLTDSDTIKWEEGSLVKYKIILFDGNNKIVEPSFLIDNIGLTTGLHSYKYDLNTEITNKLIESIKNNIYRQQKSASRYDPTIEENFIKLADAALKLYFKENDYWNLGKLNLIHECLTTLTENKNIKWIEEDNNVYHINGFLEWRFFRKDNDIPLNKLIDSIEKSLNKKSTNKEQIKLRCIGNGKLVSNSYYPWVLRKKSLYHSSCDVQHCLNIGIKLNQMFETFEEASAEMTNILKMEAVPK